jgi:hypothetical protein
MQGGLYSILRIFFFLHFPIQIYGTSLKYKIFCEYLLFDIGSFHKYKDIISMVIRQKKINTNHFIKNNSSKSPLCRQIDRLCHLLWNTFFELHLNTWCIQLVRSFLNSQWYICFSYRKFISIDAEHYV